MHEPSQSLVLAMQVEELRETTRGLQTALSAADAARTPDAGSTRAQGRVRPMGGDQTAEDMQAEATLAPANPSSALSGLAAELKVGCLGGSNALT